MQSVSASYDDNTEFPKLMATPTLPQIESQITRVFFHLNCPENANEIQTIYLQIVNLLKQIKQGMQGENKELYQEYLDTLYRMVGYTRDIREGKGDRTGSYIMLMAFHEVYPVLSQYALYAFVYGGPGEEWQYGSWRDIGPLCDLLRTYSTKRENHSLIDQMIEYTNHQLMLDNNIWKYANIRRDQKPLLLSNVSKWIPREGKKYEWVFDRLYTHWARQHYSYIMKTCESNDSYIRAQLKCKQLYRKTVATLNRAIDTPEIKMCAKQWHNIEPMTVSMHAYIKHFRALTEPNPSADRQDDVVKKQIGALKYRLFSSSANRSLSQDTISSAFLPIGYMVRRMIEINKKDVIDKQSVDEQTYLNEQWQKMSDNIGRTAKLLFMLPIVDVSITMWEKEESMVYSAVGMAILIAMRSGIQHRILATDRCATWISWDANADFSTIVKTVMSDIETMQKTRSDIQGTVEFITEMMVQSRSTKRFMENTTIIIFSDYRNNMLEQLVQGKYANISMVYWNMGHSITEPAATDINTYVSGNTVAVLKHMLRGMKPGSTNSPYQRIRSMVIHPRYDRLSNYLCGLQ